MLKDSEGPWNIVLFLLSFQKERAFSRTEEFQHIHLNLDSTAWLNIKSY